MTFTRMLRVFVLLLAALWSMPVRASEAYKLYVDGLACPFCAYGVEKKLRGVAGVDGLDIDINAGVVSVTMAEGASLDEAAARQIVKDAGFTLRDFERASPQ